MCRLQSFKWISDSMRRVKHSIMRSGSTESSFVNEINPNFWMHCSCSSLSMNLFLKKYRISFVATVLLIYIIFEILKKNVKIWFQTYFWYASAFSAASFICVDKNSTKIVPGQVDGAMNCPVGLTHKGPASLLSKKKFSTVMIDGNQRFN